jgi:F0F1-type ATP synthase assembly protein I
MPFNRPIPESKRPQKASNGFTSLVEAEKLLQVAFVLPSAVVIGWLAGAWADSMLHQKWIVIAGVVFGGISGLFYVIQTAIAAEKSTRSGDADQNGSGKGNTKNPS